MIFKSPQGFFSCLGVDHVRTHLGPMLDTCLARVRACHVRHVVYSHKPPKGRVLLLRMNTIEF